jgi:hypothetical protein
MVFPRNIYLGLVVLGILFTIGCGGTPAEPELKAPAGVELSPLPAPSSPAGSTVPTATPEPTAASGVPASPENKPSSGGVAPVSPQPNGTNPTVSPSPNSGTKTPEATKPSGAAVAQ